MQSLFLTPDLMFSSRVLGAASAAGVGLKIVPAAGDVVRFVSDDCRLVLVDLTMPGLDLPRVVAAVREKAPAARIIAFGPHVEEAMLAAAQEAGCEVLTRGQFNQQYAQLLQSAAT
jgi:DNA-binding NarL/FixJ family response regulator